MLVTCGATCGFSQRWCFLAELIKDFVVFRWGLGLSIPG